MAPSQGEPHFNKAVEGKKSPQIETIRIFVSFLELWEGCGMWRRGLSLVKVGKHWCCGGAVVYSVHGQGDEGWNPSPHGTASTYRLLLFQIHTKVLSMTMGAWRQSTRCEFNDKNKAHWLSGFKLKCLFEEGRHWLCGHGTPWSEVPRRTDGPRHCTFTILFCQADGRPITENSPELPKSET